MPPITPTTANDVSQGANRAIPRLDGDGLQVTISPITLENDPNSLINESAYKGGTYTDYIIKNIYEKDGSIYMMGATTSAGTTDSVAFCRISAPTLVWICDWTACRLGDKPKIPSREPASADWVFLDEFLEEPNMTVMGDGDTPLWRMTGTYVYGHKNPSKADLLTLTAFPRPPWIQDTLTRTVTTNITEKNLSSASTAGTGAKPNLTGFLTGG